MLGLDPQYLSAYRRFSLALTYFFQSRSAQTVLHGYSAILAPDRAEIMQDTGSLDCLHELVPCYVTLFTSLLIMSGPPAFQQPPVSI